jgi:hypothetical protein
VGLLRNLTWEQSRRLARECPPATEADTALTPASSRPVEGHDTRGHLRAPTGPKATAVSAAASSVTKDLLRARPRSCVRTGFFNSPSVPRKPDREGAALLPPPLTPPDMLNGGTARETSQTYAATLVDQSAVYVLNTGRLTLVSCTMTKTGDASNTDSSTSTASMPGYWPILPVR